MTVAKFPRWYSFIKQNHPQFMECLERLGESVRQEGPLDEKTAQLIQLAAAAAVRSQGAVHSHVRRAREAGASPAEIYHALLLLTSTIGFPTVSAALSWAHDLLAEKEK